MAIGVEGCVDDARLPLSHLVVADAEAFDDARAVVLDNDVGIFEQAPEDLEPFGALEVEQHAALASVDVVVETDAALALGRIDLDDVRAELSESAAAGRTSEDDTKVEDAHAGQGRARF